MGSATMLAGLKRASMPLIRAPMRSTQLLPSVTRAAGFRPSSSSAVLASDDHSYDYTIKKLEGDVETRRAFNYMVLGGARFIYASATRLIAMKFIASMSASADVLALASTEVNIGEIEPGDA